MLLRAERDQPRWCGALWTQEDADPELRRVVMALTLWLGLGVRAGGRPLWGHLGTVVGKGRGGGGRWRVESPMILRHGVFAPCRCFHFLKI